MMANIVLRKIRHGRVKIGHKWFRPSEKWMEYDGRLDGMVYGFGRYRDENGYTDYVCLWGPEQNYREPDTDKWIPDPQVVDGWLPWSWWNEEE